MTAGYFSYIVFFANDYIFTLSSLKERNIALLFAKHRAVGTSLAERQTSRRRQYHCGFCFVNYYSSSVAPV